ncbi:Thiamine biosynthetic bifunctional enzyme TH1 chloroplastic [Bienertia sinuspersici]
MLNFQALSVPSTSVKLSSLIRAPISDSCARYSMVLRENGGPKTKIRHVMTVAGSDSGAGAGIQADLKTCAALGVYCSTVLTAVTAQNTFGVQGVNILPEDFVAEQIKSVLSDMEVDVVKTGMLPSVGMVKVLLQSLKEHPEALVVDPVMVATSGDVLAGSSVLPVFREELLPMADLVTPNLKEASSLIGGMRLETVADMRSAAKLIYDMGPREKNLETRDFIEAAKECVSIGHSKGVPILINDRVDVALACNADGVHVGQSDMPVFTVRSLLGPEKIIGVSCKTPEQAQEAWVNGADYIGSGGVFPTNTKANNRTIGLDGLKEVCLASKLPVVAIGGIGISNAQSVMEIDAPNLEGVAVVSGLFNSESVLSATKQLHGVLKQAVSTRK